MKAGKLLFLFICLISILPTIAQGRISFAYDETGNRVKREIIITQKSRAMEKPEDKDESYYDALGDRMIKIARNGSGVIKVTVINMASDDECYIDVCSIDGMQVFIETHGGAETIIDISNRPDGIYILRVVVNETQTIWKITKS